MPTSVVPPRPSLVNAIGIMTLLSGLANLAWGLISLSSFLGLLCLPVSILPFILAAFELLYGARILVKPLRPLRPARAMAVCEVLCLLFGNFLSMIVGILSLIFYHDAAVERYFSEFAPPSG